MGNLFIKPKPQHKSVGIRNIRSNPYSLSCIPVFLKQEAVKPGGHVIMATFASEGPERCSGLQVSSDEPESLHRDFGDSFILLDGTKEVHRTPLGTEQKIIYCYCRKA